MFRYSNSTITILTLILLLFSCSTTANEHRCFEPPRIEAKHANIYTPLVQRTRIAAIYNTLAQHHQTRYINLFVCDPRYTKQFKSEKYQQPFNLFMQGCHGKSNLVELFDNPYSSQPVARYSITDNGQLHLFAVK